MVLPHIYFLGASNFYESQVKNDIVAGSEEEFRRRFLREFGPWVNLLDLHPASPPFTRRQDEHVTNYQPTALGRGRRGRSFEAVTVEDLDREDWLPPSNVLLDDAVVYIVTKLCDKKTRARRWKADFDSLNVYETPRLHHILKEQYSNSRCGLPQCSTACQLT